MDRRAALEDSLDLRGPLHRRHDSRPGDGKSYAPEVNGDQRRARGRVPPRDSIVSFKRQRLVETTRPPCSLPPVCGPPVHVKSPPPTEEGTVFEMAELKNP